MNKKSSNPTKIINKSKPFCNLGWTDGEKMPKYAKGQLKDATGKFLYNIVLSKNSYADIQQPTKRGLLATILVANSLLAQNSFSKH